MANEQTIQCFRCKVKGPGLVSCQTCVRKYHEQCAGPTHPDKPPWNCLECRKPSMVYDVNRELECWYCLQPSNRLPKCSTCCRSYHKTCLRMATTGSPRSCQLCQPSQPLAELERGKWRSYTPKIVKFHKCLAYAVEAVFCAVKEAHLFFPFKQELFGDLIDGKIQYMDIEGIWNKVQLIQYNSVDAFYADWEMIAEYIRILPEGCDMEQAINNMLETAHEQAESIRCCQECYIARQEKPTNWFEETCTNPHLLVWGKVRGYRFWPAKLMDILPNGQVWVHFFGTHSLAKLNANDCLLYNRRDPTGRPCSTKEWRKALCEIDAHLIKLTERFGCVNINALKSLKSASIQEHLEAMFPRSIPLDLSRHNVVTPAWSATPFTAQRPLRREPTPSTSRRPVGRPRRKLPTTSGSEPTPSTSRRPVGRPRRTLPTTSGSVPTPSAPRRPVGRPRRTLSEPGTSLGSEPTPSTSRRPVGRPRRTLPEPGTSLGSEPTPSTSPGTSLGSEPTPSTSPGTSLGSVPTPSAPRRPVGRPRRTLSEPGTSLGSVPTPSTSRRPVGRPRRTLPEPGTSLGSEPTPSTSPGTSLGSEPTPSTSPGTSLGSEPTPSTSRRPAGRPRRTLPEPSTSLGSEPTPSTSPGTSLGSVPTPSAPRRPVGRPRRTLSEPGTSLGSVPTPSTSRRPVGRPRRTLPEPGTSLGSEPTPSTSPGTSLGSEPTPSTSPGTSLGSEPTPSTSPGTSLGSEPTPSTSPGTSLGSEPTPSTSRRPAGRPRRTLPEPSTSLGSEPTPSTSRPILSRGCLKRKLKNAPQQQVNGNAKKKRPTKQAKRATLKKRNPVAAKRDGLRSSKEPERDPIRIVLKMSRFTTEDRGFIEQCRFLENLGLTPVLKEHHEPGEGTSSLGNHGRTPVLQQLHDPLEGPSSLGNHGRTPELKHHDPLEGPSSLGNHGRTPVLKQHLDPGEGPSK